MDQAGHTPLQPVPMLDFSREFARVREDVLAAIERVCAAQHFILGPEVARFEDAAAEACAVPFAVGCASGTDALWLALAALKLGPGDAVLTTPFSFFATVSSILRAGATPVLADIDERTFNLSPDAVERTLRAHPRELPPIRAIMPVHLFGQTADMDALGRLALDHNLRIIEDAAQAFGARWRVASGRDESPAAPFEAGDAATASSLSTPAGALGDAAAFSFYPTKNLAAYGDAGMLTTRREEVAERARMLRAHGMRRRYFHDEIGWNSRLDTLQAAVLEVKLRRLDAGNARRRELAALYTDRFTAAGLAAATTAHGIVLPWVDPRATPVWHQYVIRAPRRDDLRAFLTQHQIGCEIYYPLPLHLQQSLRSLGYRAGDFPASERAAQEVLALPIYPELREDELETVVEGIRRFYA